jgi:hypothetical protein
MARVIFDPTGLLSDTQELDHHARAVSVSMWHASAPSARIFVGQKQGPKYGLPFTTNSRPGRFTGPLSRGSYRWKPRATPRRRVGYG